MWRIIAKKKRGQPDFLVTLCFHSIKQEGWIILHNLLHKTHELLEKLNSGYQIFHSTNEGCSSPNCSNNLYSYNLYMDMRAGTTNVFGQLCGCNTLLPHYFLDMLPDVHKKAWNLSLAEHRVSTPTSTTSYSTPIKAFRNVFLLKYLC